MNNRRVGKFAVTAIVGLLYLKDSASPDYFIAVNRFHPTQTKRVKRI